MEGQEKKNPKEKSVYEFLASYTPRQGHNPREDFLTQLFAWHLANIPELAKAYIIELNQLNQNQAQEIKFPKDNMHDTDIDDDINVETQHKFTNEKIADMIITIKANEQKKYFIFEHKLGSDLGENQIENYVEGVKKDYNVEERDIITILVTPDKREVSSDIDYVFRWEHVYTFIKQFMGKRGKKSYDGENMNANYIDGYYKDASHCLLDQFLWYMEEQELGPAR